MPRGSALAGAAVAATLLFSAGFGVRAQDRPSDGLHAADAESRRDAIMRLEMSQDPNAAPLVAPLLDDADERVRGAAAAALGRLGATSEVARLADVAARDKRPFVRKIAAYSLGEIGDASAVPALVERTRRDKDREVRAAAVTALGQIGDASATDALRARLSDKEPFVRREAVRSLGLVGARAAVPELVARLESDTEADVRRAAAEALGRLGDPSARAALGVAIHDTDPYVAEAALAALGAIDPARAGGGQKP